MFLVQESHWLPAALGDHPFVELDEAQRHYLAFLHRMVAEGRHVAGMDQVWLGLLTEGRGMGPAVAPRIAPRIAKVQRHMEAHLADPLTNEELAAIACLGLSQFKHAFRQQVGTSVSHYLRMRRMALARTLLAQTRPAHRRGGQPLRLPEPGGLCRALPGRDRTDPFPLAPAKRLPAVIGRLFAEDNPRALEAC